MCKYHSPNHQNGAVLIVSLIMLLLLTLIGVTGTQVTSLEEKMASNMRDRNLAFQAAESALQFAETSICPTVANCPDTTKTFTTAGTGGLYSLTSTLPTSTALMTDDFWTGNPVATYTATALGNDITDPNYIIQELGTSCAVITTPCPAGNVKNNYRITARATGGTTNAVVLLQSIYQVP